MQESVDKEILSKMDRGGDAVFHALLHHAIHANDDFAALLANFIRKHIRYV